MNDAIRTRRSVRKYSTKEIPDDLKKKIEKIIADAKPLSPNINYRAELLDAAAFSETFQTKVKSPGYILFYSEDTDGSLENIGYIGEQIILEITKLGLSTCWQGGIKIRHEKEFEMPPIIGVAVGYIDEKLQLSPQKRKHFNKVVAGDEPTELQRELFSSVMLAPSAINLQPIYYVIEDRTVHVFKRNYFLKIKNLEGVQCVDIGIALAHITLEAARLDLKFAACNYSERAAEISGDRYITSLVFDRK